jgi:hypothetical protein
MSSFNHVVALHLDPIGVAKLVTHTGLAELVHTDPVGSASKGETSFATPEPLVVRVFS